MAIPGKLRDFVNEQRQPLPPVTDADEPLNLESVQMMPLVTFLEPELTFKVDDSQLIPENFESLRALERLLNGKGQSFRRENLRAPKQSGSLRFTQAAQFPVCLSFTFGRKPHYHRLHANPPLPPLCWPPRPASTYLPRSSYCRCRQRDLERQSGK
jgi:acyl carrier protein